jgi:hypothetical protein
MDCHRYRVSHERCCIAPNARWSKRGRESLFLIASRRDDRAAAANHRLSRLVLSQRRLWVPPFFECDVFRRIEIGE